MNSDRRTVLKGVAAAALPWATSSPAWAKQKYSKDPFGLGVASGSPTHDSVVLWTRLFDEGFFSSNLPSEDLPVRWEMATDTGFSSGLRSGVATAVSALAHAVHVEVEGLPANTVFHYRFLAGEFVSRAGRTRTFARPDGGVQPPLRLALASCQHFELGHFNAYAHMVDDQPDLAIFLGDYIYEYAPGKAGVRTHTPGACISLEDYRKRYAQYRQDADLQLAHASFPWLVIWDDHEVQNDYAGLQQGTHGPAADFAKRRASAYQAFYEHMPLRRSALVDGVAGLASGAELRIFGGHRFGDLLGIHLLDARQYRDAQACTPDGKFGSATIDPEACTTLGHTGRSLLGQRQEAWLESRLASAQGQTWNLLAQTTLLGARVSRTREGPRLWNDSWDGYPAARARLVNQLATLEVPNPVVVGGDVHESWVGHVKRDYAAPDSANVGTEFCVTSISSFDGRDPTARLKANPHFMYADGSRKGYALMDVSREVMVVTYRCVKDHRSRVTDIETTATFKVHRGKAVVERV